MPKVTTTTQKITREKLARFFGNHEVVKLMENLTQDVSTALPDAVNQNVSDSEETVDSAMVALMSAGSARNSAAIAESLVREATALIQTNRSLASEVAALRREISELRAITQGTRSWL